MAVVELPLGAGVVRFAGVGNIAGVILDGAAAPRHMVSHSGIVGQNLPRVHEFDYPWRAGDLLVLASDGLATRWSVDRYPGLLTRHPSLVAGVLYRDFSRGRDDTTVLVARAEATGGT